MGVAAHRLGGGGLALATKRFSARHEQHFGRGLAGQVPEGGQGHVGILDLSGGEFA
jgi:hypothetical protein